MPPIVVMPDLDVSKEISKDGQVEMDFLLPNGVFIPLQVDFFESIDNIKKRIWKEAENFPLYKKLQKWNNYLFIYVNQNGERDEMSDEDLTLNDYRLAARFLKLVEKPPNDKRNTLDKQTNLLIGMKGQQCIEAQMSPDISDFRTKMQQLCNDIVSRRNRDATGHQRFRYKYPPRLRGDGGIGTLPEYMQKIVQNGIMITVLIEETGTSYKLRRPHDSQPDTLLNDVVTKWANTTGMRRPDSNNYTLKAVGMEDYLYGDNPLLQFKYIYSCLLRDMSPSLVLVKKDKIIDKVAPQTSTRRPGPQKTIKRENGVLVWHVPQSFKITIVGVTKVDMPDSSKVRLDVGLYHGQETLCVTHTQPTVVCNNTCTWKKEVPFETKVEDLPSACRLCFALYQKKGRDFIIIAWVNIPVFDHRNRLLCGQYKLPMWPRQDNLELCDNCNPIGTVAINPQGDFAATLEFQVPDYGKNQHIIYPTQEKVLECANDNMEPYGKPGAPNWHPSKTHKQQLEEILCEDACGSRQLAMQERELVWIMRFECRDKYPYALPILLNAVKWDNHIDVCQMLALLQTWQILEFDHALALLDFHFPDKNVRQFACKCLEYLGDEEVSQYLLQLVQALRFENHLICPLAEFLLSRALNNQHIGHQLYWLLKSELHETSVTVRYSLMLEVYLKTCQEHIPLLSHQQEVLLKLSFLNQIAKNAAKNVKKVQDDVKLMMKQKVDILSDLRSPLSPLYSLKTLQVDSCRVMDSKKRPLMLEWTNSDSKGQNVIMMYKNGDDLRQDMLTLQIFQVMDSFWKSEGLDLRLNPYGCVATGREEGMIEIVQKSHTIANIQKWKNRGAFAKEALFEWMKSKNPNPENLNRAVEDFTYSCAGYAVATYILGIGDRHNDNIMMKESGQRCQRRASNFGLCSARVYRYFPGVKQIILSYLRQLFHIDFGHILGNFKSKLNIKRERVPFILTSHFEYVIKKGDTNPENFKKFQSICETAYLIIRKRGTLLMRLFMMMLSAGIPQLTCISDVDYLKDTLALDLTEEEARRKFNKKFKEAQEKSWSTSLNWFFHIAAH